MFLLEFWFNHDDLYLKGKKPYKSVQRAAELAPDDKGFKEYLLFYYEIPEQLLTEEEAIEIAKEVLGNDPKSMVAMSVLKEKH